MPAGPDYGESRQPTTDEVKIIQQALGIQETDYGPRTQQAVAKLQMENDIQVNDVVDIGALTWSLIVNQYEKTMEKLEKEEPQSLLALETKALRRDLIRQEAAQYRETAHQLIADTRTPEERKVRMTTAYADLYLQDPNRMLWPGLAFFASRVVGDGLRDSTKFAKGEWPVWHPELIPGQKIVEKKMGEELHSLFAAGNKAIFENIYWVNIAFREKGIDFIHELRDAGEIDPALANAFDKSDSGFKMKHRADTGIGMMEDEI